MLILLILFHFARISNPRRRQKDIVMSMSARPSGAITKN